MNVRIKCDLPFSAAIFYNGQFRINHFSLRLWMTTNHSDSDCHNIALERIKYFVYNELDSTVFIYSKNVAQCEKFVSAGIKITTFPTEPVDQVVGIMLYHKLNAIMEQHMIVVETEISSTLGDNITYLHSESEQINNLESDTWWVTPDLVHCDLSWLINDKVLALPQGNAWRDLDLAWPDYVTDSDAGNVVVFADFKSNDSK